MLAASSSAVGLYIGAGIIGYILYALAFVGIFKKADQPVWAAFVPIVNYYFVLKIIGRPWWWLLLLLIPCVNIVVFIIVVYDLSKSFGHGVGFAVGLYFLSIIFLYILGYGSSQYLGPSSPTPPNY